MDDNPNVMEIPRSTAQVLMEQESSVMPGLQWHSSFSVIEITMENHDERYLSKSFRHAIFWAKTQTLVSCELSLVKFSLSPSRKLLYL